MSERQQLSATVHGKLETLSRVDASKKLVRSGLGELDFEPGVPVLETTVDLFKDLHSLDSNILPLAMLRRIDQRADATLNTLREIEGFDLKQSNPAGTRAGLLQRLENDYDAHVSELGAYLGYLLVKRTNFNELDAAAREKTREFGEFIDRTREEQDRIRDELAAALRSVRAAAADAGVGQQSIAFEKQVKVYTASARGWLRAAIWSGGLSAIAVGGLLFAWAPSAETTGEIVREIGGRSPL